MAGFDGEVGFGDGLVADEEAKVVDVVGQYEAACKVQGQGRQVRSAVLSFYHLSGARFPKTSDLIECSQQKCLIL